MSRKMSYPTFYRQNIARQAVRKYKASKAVKAEDERSISEKRKDAAELLADCICEVLQTEFSVSEAEIKKIEQKVTLVSRYCEGMEKTMGAEKVKEWLIKDTQDIMTDYFYLPIDEWPKKERGQAEMSVIREAGDVAARIYLKAAREVIELDQKKAAAILSEAKEEYRNRAFSAA